MPDEQKPRMLPPSLRGHKRYIVYQAVTEAPMAYGEFVNAIWNTLLTFLGELHASEAKVWMVHNLYDANAQTGVIKCQHDMVESVRVALALMQQVGETRCVVRVLGVTGTIKSAKNKYLSSKEAQG